LKGGRVRDDWSFGADLPLHIKLMIEERIQFEKPASHALASTVMECLIGADLAKSGKNG
jgi:hypothetical protein